MERTKKNNNLYESRLLKLNSNKARKKINWKPKLNFDETIEMTTSWYKNFYENKQISVFELSKKQISYYTKKIGFK